MKERHRGTEKLRRKIRHRVPEEQRKRYWGFSFQQLGASVSDTKNSSLYLCITSSKDYRVCEDVYVLYFNPKSEIRNPQLGCGQKPALGFRVGYKNFFSAPLGLSVGFSFFLFREPHS
jgi:hypothetical protein